MAIPEWIHLSKTTGASEVFTNITISADTNTGTTSRSYTLTVTGGTPGDIASATIEVTQEGRPEYLNNYLTFKITSPGDINWVTPSWSSSGRRIYYRKNYSSTSDDWHPITATTASSFSVTTGDVVEFKGVSSFYSERGSFSASTAGFKVSGNIMSMVYGDDFADKMTLSDDSNFQSLFINCTGLTEAVHLYLPASSLTPSCYAYMFSGCASLTSTPELPITTLADGCYSHMFNGCTSLTTAPELPATTLSNNCYRGMFKGCTRLVNPPEVLVANIVPQSAYYDMFNGCTSLTSSPVISAHTFNETACSSMFYDCTSLNEITCFTRYRTGNSTQNWVYNVAVSGTFIQHQFAKWGLGYNGIPTTWVVYREYDIKPLTFKIISGGTINWYHRRTLIDDVGDKTIEYRINDGNWTSITSSSAGSSFNVSTGDIVEFRGDNTQYGSLPLSYNTFSGTTATFEVYGNTMSLINSTGYTGVTDLTEQYAFNRLFAGCTGLTTAEYLVLPTTTLPMHVYSSMFEGCTSMTAGPELPAATLTNSCYNEMFSGCNSLSKIRCLATDISAYNCTYNWVSNVASSGTFIKASSMTGWGSGNSGIPSGWSTEDA